MPERNPEGDWKKAGKEFLNFTWIYTQVILDTLHLVQDQAQRMLSTLTQQQMGLQNEAQKMFQEWTENLKKGATTYRKLMDDNFKKAEEFFKS